MESSNEGTTLPVAQLCSLYSLLRNSEMKVAHTQLHTRLHLIRTRVRGCVRMISSRIKESHANKEKYINKCDKCKKSERET